MRDPQWIFPFKVTTQKRILTVWIDADPNTRLAPYQTLIRCLHGSDRRNLNELHQSQAVGWLVLRCTASRRSQSQNVVAQLGKFLLQQCG
jgi:hypothetical protein